MKVTLHFPKGLVQKLMSNAWQSWSITLSAMKASQKIWLVGFLFSLIFFASYAQKSTALLPKGDSCLRSPQPTSIRLGQRAASSSAQIRLAYVIPSNRTAQPDGVADFQNAIKIGQQWFKEQMEQLGFGPKTFAVETEADGVTPLVHVVHVAETDDYLRGDIWGRTQTAAINAGLSLWATGEVWVVIPEAHLMLSDGTVTGGMAGGASFGSGDNPGLAMIGSNALPLFRPGAMTDDTSYDGKVLPALGPFPMKQDVTFSWFEGTTLSSLASTWLGALWHEMGHAVAALPHDFRNDENFHGNIMGNGLRGTRGSLFPEKYPQDYTRLEYSSALILNGSHYFNNDKIVTSGPGLSFSNSGTITPENGHVKIEFQATDEDSLAMAYLGYRGEIVAELVLDGNAVDTAFRVPYFIPGEVNPFDFSVYDKQGNRAFSGPLDFFIPAGYNKAPIPFIRIEPPVPGLNQPVRLDASRSSSVFSLTAAWDVDNDGQYDTPPTTNMVTDYLYQSGGNYLIRLKLTDDAGAETVSTPVSVKIPGEKNVAIENFRLIDADNDSTIRVMQNNMVIRYSAWKGKTFSIEAKPSGVVIDHIEFELTGPINHKQTERVAPYSLFGDNPPGSYNGKQLLVGDYTLTATPYSSGGKGISRTVFFRVIDSNLTSPPVVVFDKTFGGKGSDYQGKMIATNDGGYLMAGTSDSNMSGDKTENARGSADYWILKLDSEYNKEWDKTIGGDGYDELWSVVPAFDGGYLLAGYTTSGRSADKSEDSRGDYDYWVVKVDKYGNKQWDRTFGGSGQDQLRIATTTPDGCYLLGGFSSSDLSGDKTEGGQGGYDYWIVKIDRHGNKIWDKTIGGSDRDYLNSIIATIDGSLLFGFSYSDLSGDKSENSKGLKDYWVVKIDDQGNKVWDKTIGGYNIEELEAAIATDDGGYLMGGYSNSDLSGDKSEDSQGVGDFWVVKIDASGNKHWDRTFGGNEHESITSFARTPDGDYLLGGYSRSDTSGDKSEDNRSDLFDVPDYWVVKIDAVGNKLWDKTIGGNDGEAIASMIVTDEGYLLAGSSNSAASGDKTTDSKSDFVPEIERFYPDFWIVKLQESGPAAVTSLTLINAYTEQPIKQLKNGDVIRLTETGRFLDVRADIPAANITQVDFHLKGPLTHQQTERVAPYALFGDLQGNFNGRYILPGAYTLTVTPYINNSKAASLTVSFAVTEGFNITGFTLIDATLDQPIGALAEGQVIDLSILNDHKLAVRADSDPLQLEKVDLTLQGPFTYASTERVYPYALFGDVTQNGSTDYTGAKMFPGTYTLTAVPYFGSIKGSAHAITFTVIKGGATYRQVEVYPIPSSDVINIKNEANTTAHITLLDFSGNVVLDRTLRQESIEQLDVKGLGRGIHYLKVVGPKGVEIIRVVIE
ncbi:T9SS type A sorting domain-containing protein [Chryseolinea sp. H1M3-3]|uniref:T9SS type A sorting domain-containing protein n=1 Tax=Chryseolinea sp. H1M3-3 TaxID=3034144 RepID=UPI0023EE191C|nr:T9SS type A sorting domain-containing protein [Chryseolinea sp. H1M3-3]